MTAPDPRLGEIEARLAAATPGPWKWEGESKEAWPQSDNSLVTDYTPAGEQFPDAILSGWGYDASGISVEKDEDGELIANAPTDVAYLLAKLRARDEALALVGAEAWDLAAEHAREYGLFYDAEYREVRTANPSRAAVAAANGGGE